MAEDDEPNEDFYNTGPFCRHWSDPSDCEIVCASCGHKCTDHSANDGETDCDECDCAAWIEPDVIGVMGL